MKLDVATLTRILVGVLPVIIFLTGLTFIDSYKLIRFRSILLNIFVGIIIAFVCSIINGALIGLLGFDRATFAKHVAPFVEEILKACFIVYLIYSKRIGFMVDAAICGFAVGTGFAIIENLQLLGSMQDSNMIVWIVRGFGTAVMHGGSTAIFAIVSKSFFDRHSPPRPWFFLPGLAMAVIIHSTYNHFFVSPEVSAIAIVAGLPVVMIVVFQQSERALQRWLGAGFDTDAELLEMIATGNVSRTRIGEYLLSLKSRFPGEVVADMLCLLRIHLELSIRAKGLLLMREAGFEIPKDPEVTEKFEELKYLEKSVGKTGRLAIMPFLRWSSRDLWQLHMLGKK